VRLFERMPENLRKRQTKNDL